MTRLRRGTVAVVALLAFTAVSCASAAHEEGTSKASLLAAQQFLRDYVTTDGAVVRRDQGGDVVSEGQGYAMLLAYALDEPRLFAKLWTWTRAHLQRPDRLFAYHWQSGAVVDATPAADADVQIAWALALAGKDWSIPADLTAARQIAEAVAQHELGYDDDGHPTIAAGPWALGSGRPVQVEPGYWTFPADTALAKLTGDHRWEALAPADAAHLSSITRAGSDLPPDWGTLGNGATPTAASTPQTGAPPASAQDGLRAMVWAACLPAAHPLATKWWRAVAATAQQGPLARSLDGTPATPGPSALSLVAAAATAKVAGKPQQMASLLRHAARLASEHPTYYGNAWNALGHVLLTTDLIPGCTT